MSHAYLIGQLIVFLKLKIALDFWTKTKCHSYVSGDSAEGHLLDSDVTVGLPSYPLTTDADIPEGREWQHLRRSCVRRALVRMWLQRQMEIALDLVKGLLQTAQWEGRIKGITCWRAGIQPSKWS